MSGVYIIFGLAVVAGLFGAAVVAGLFGIAVGAGLLGAAGLDWFMSSYKPTTNKKKEKR